MYVCVLEPNKSSKQLCLFLAIKNKDLSLKKYKAASFFYRAAKES